MAEKAAFSITITKLNPATLTVSLRKDIGPFDTSKCSVSISQEGYDTLKAEGITMKPLKDSLATILNTAYSDLFFKKDYQTGEYIK